MSIEKINDTEWARTYPNGCVNDEHPIEVTKEGIEIDFDLLTWEEIDAAREKIKHAD